MTSIAYYALYHKRTQFFRILHKYRKWAIIVLNGKGDIETIR